MSSGGLHFRPPPRKTVSRSLRGNPGENHERIAGLQDTGKVLRSRRRLEEHKLLSQALDLGDVGMMKVLADQYFLWRFDQLARERASIDKRNAVKTA